MCFLQANDSSDLCSEYRICLLWTCFGLEYESSPNEQNHKLLAEKFASFFASKIRKKNPCQHQGRVMQVAVCKHKWRCIKKCPKTDSLWTDITSRRIRTNPNSPSKHCSLDVLLTWLSKQHALVFASSIYCINNASLHWSCHRIIQRNGLLAGQPACHLHNLQMAQNTTARTVTLAWKDLFNKHGTKAFSVAVMHSWNSLAEKL